MAGGAVDEVLCGLARVDHEAVGELHGLGTGGAELAGDDNLAALGAGLHDEAQDTIAGTADGQAVEQLVAQGLALGDGGQTAVLDLGGVEGDGVLGELEALLDQRGELADAAALLAEDLLGVGGADDDVGDGGSDADLDAGVALLSELALEELVELGVEDTVGDELSPLGAGRDKMLVDVDGKKSGDDHGDGGDKSFYRVDGNSTLALCSYILLFLLFTANALSMPPSLSSPIFSSFIIPPPRSKLMPSSTPTTCEPGP